MEETTEKTAKELAEVATHFVVNTIHKGIYDYSFDQIVSNLRTVKGRDQYFLALVNENLDPNDFIAWWTVNKNYLSYQDEDIKVAMLTLLAGVALYDDKISLVKDAIDSAKKYVSCIDDLPSLCKLFTFCITNDNAASVWRDSLKATLLLESQPNK